MSENPTAPVVETVPLITPTSTTPISVPNTAATAPKKPAAEGNPAFRALGLPRLRLPSRNWTIFLTVVGSFTGAVLYDKWQTRLVKEKWQKAVAHLADEQLPVRSMPRRLTIYLAAPPGDGLRSAREHFHDYVKPVLVAAAMDWDVVEGRKEGDVRYKTAERIRRKRKRAGEGAPLTEEEEAQYAVDRMREATGTTEYDGVAGDLVVGRHTWKEYIRGLHEGWLGPADAPQQPEVEGGKDADLQSHSPGHSSVGDAAVSGAAQLLTAGAETSTSEDTLLKQAQVQDTLSKYTQGQNTTSGDEKAKAEEVNKEEEKPKPRNPSPYIDPIDYSTAQLSTLASEIIGPSTAIPFPHILGFRNTPIRMHRFFTRRRIADDVGRQVATAVLASHNRSFSAVSATDEESPSGGSGIVPEQSQVLVHEERDWWKTVRDPRKEHEESVWIEDVVLDERVAGRMRMFQMLGEDEERIERIAKGKEGVLGKNEEER